MARNIRISTCPIVNKVAKNLMKLGWRRLKVTGHPRLRSPDSALTITVPKTASDHRSTQNWLHQLRRLGVPTET